MKQILVLTINVLLICSTQKLTAQSSADEAAIIALLQQAVKDRTTLSLAEVVKKHWILDDKTALSISLRDGAHFQFDAEQLQQQTIQPPPDHADASRDNFVVKVEGNMAFATCHGKATLKESGNTLLFFEIRVLEKINGAWKIHISSIHEYVKGG